MVDPDLAAARRRARLNQQVPPPPMPSTVFLRPNLPPGSVDPWDLYSDPLPSPSPSPSLGSFVPPPSLAQITATGNTSGPNWYNRPLDNGKDFYGRPKDSLTSGNGGLNFPNLSMPDFSAIKDIANPFKSILNPGNWNSSSPGFNTPPASPYTVRPTTPGPNYPEPNPNANSLFRQGERGSFGTTGSPQVEAGASQETPEDRLAKQLDLWYRANAASGNYQPPDPSSFADQAKKQAAALMAAQFDPQIKALQAAMAQAEKRTGRSKKDIGDMYDALARDYEKELGKTKKQYAGRKADQAKLTKNLKKEIATEYTTRNQEQMNTLKSLGIQSAARDMLPEQADDQAFLNSLVANEDLSEQRLLDNYQASEEDYESSGITASQQEGAASQAELMAQLENFLSQRSAEIAGLQGQKGSQQVATAMQIQNDLAKAAAEQSRWAYQMEGDRLSRWLQGIGVEKDMVGDRYDFLARQMAAAKAGSGSQNVPKEGIAGAQAYIENNAAAAGINPQEVLGAVYETMNRQEVKEGQFNTNRKDINQLPIYKDLKPEMIAQYAREIGNQRRYTPQQQQLLTNAIYTLYGMMQ